MANFSSFFPTAATGGGGFTKMNKYTTARGLGDATNKISSLNNNSGTLVTDGSAGTPFDLIYDQPAQSIAAAPSTYTINNLRFDSSTALNVGAVIPANFFAGGTVRFSYSGVNNINLQRASLISSHPEFTYANSSSSLVLSYSTNPDGAFSASARTNLGTGDTVPLTLPTSITVNPATDLGLSDGDSIGYMLIGAGNSNNSSTEKGGAGGNILQGTAIISNASTNLTITPAAVTGTNSAGAASTITGGLTLSSADGMPAGWGAFGTSTRAAAAWSGINGYSLGGGQHNEGGAGGVLGNNGDGFGWGSYNSGVRASDGAVLLYY
mgnify:CR=1 FL=1|tara:strand:- start:398 stop:1366 length:969 start_codon:yes stop_codon:yes gene_type:complete